ncbi:MAG: TrmH family RNA methyltransferase [Bacteroidota bacterium]
MKQERQINFEDQHSNSKQSQQNINDNRYPIVFILDRVSNPRNIGSLFRLAEAARIEHIYIFGALESMQSSKFNRAARSTEKYIPFTLINDWNELQKLKEKYSWIGLEITTQSIPYYQYQPSGPTAMVIGSEKYGLSEAMIAACEKCIHVPMLGLKTSMNVAVATGIATYKWLENFGFDR